MSKNCDIMKRMKENYESRSRTFLTRRTPVIMRLDGKAFHTYTKHLVKPFDEGLIEDMAATALFLCSEIQGAKVAYVQSDEISILITDFDKLTTSAWFDYNVQKMTSISASLASAKFNSLRLQRVFKEMEKLGRFSSPMLIDDPNAIMFVRDMYEVNINTQDLAYFDSRVFNVPKEEVANYFLARQKDAVKNSIAMLAQSLYSHKELHGKNQSDMQELSFQKGHNWNDLHWSKKRGSTIVKKTYVGGEDLSKTDELGEPIITIFEEDGKTVYSKWCNDTGFWVDMEDQTVRTKWAVVETPMAFNQSYFDEYVKKG